MPHKIILVILSLVLFGCSSSNSRVAIEQAEDAETSRQTPSAAELGHCPFGHTHLKDVPITYGESKGSPELARQLQTLELWDGGCVVSNVSPHTKVVCPDCGYCYERDDKAWFKSAKELSAFRLPFSKLITDFPTPPGAHMTYYQTVRGSEVSGERVTYCADDASPDIAPRIAHYFQTAGLVLEGDFRLGPADASMDIKGESSGNLVRLRMTTPTIQGHVTVDYSIVRNGSATPP